MIPIFIIINWTKLESLNLFQDFLYADSLYLFVLFTKKIENRNRDSESMRLAIFEIDCKNIRQTIGHGNPRKIPLPGGN